MPGTYQGHEDVDLQDDPYIVAEQELRDISGLIEQTARKLQGLKQRGSVSVQADESLSFEDQILEAAKSITAAIGTLVKAATEAQKELVAKGSSGEAEAKWSQDLIAAARLTATATSSLCDGANAAVRGDPSEEKLVSSARAVADSTRKLLDVCRMNGDPNGRTQKGLQTAGAAVAAAAGALVDAATGANVFRIEEEEMVQQNEMTDEMKEELEIQELILKKEKELEKARSKLHHIREMNRIEREREEAMAEMENEGK